ncbi:MAG: RDD family protein [Acidobacteriota bacterium]
MTDLVEPSRPAVGNRSPLDASQDPRALGGARGATARDGGILGLDNVQLDLELAGIGSRTLAIVLDYLVLMVGFALVLSGALAVASIFAFESIWPWVIGLLAIFALQLGYFAAFEIATQGRTPGKMALGLRSVSDLGGRPSTSAFLVRNLLRAIDTPLGVLPIMLDGRCRRFGDMVAHTLVVHDRPERATVDVGRVPTAWGLREVTVVESFLERADRMEEARAAAMAQEILDWMWRRHPQFLAEAGLTEPGIERGDPVLWLRAVLATPAPSTSAGSAISTADV